MEALSAPADTRTPEQLRRELEAALRTNAVLMDRIERSAASPGPAVLNTHALALQELVRQRTRSLEQMNEGLIHAATQRKRVDRILREMQRIANIGGWELQVESGTVELTEQMLALLGLPAGSDLKVQVLCAAFVEGDGRRLEKHLAAAYERRETFDLELEARRGAGPGRMFRVVGHPVIDGTTVARVYGVIQDITARKQAEAQLENTNQRLLEVTRKHELILNSMTEGIHWVARDGRIIFENPASARLLGWEVSELIGRPAHETMHHTRAGGAPYLKAECAIYQTLQTGNPVRVDNEMFWRKDGTGFPVEYSCTPVRDEAGQIAGTVVVFSDISQRRNAEAELELTNKRLIDVSRQAGMAEVATGVLHNVGNVLNSVNVSSSLVTDRLRKSKLSNLSRAAVMLREHETDLAAFLTTDPRGKLVPAFLTQLAEHLTGEQESVLRELEHLQNNIEHIKEIVSTQQAYASSAGFIELLDLRESLDHALRMHQASLGRDGVVVVRKFEAIPKVAADKHKVLQILINLIRNARHAMLESAEKTLTISTEASADGGVRVRVRDTGCGIAQENMTRIFAHGFTTKKDGHGFGLHSSALAAKEMKGSLVAQSDGEGKGATFTLEIPMKA